MVLSGDEALVGSVEEVSTSGLGSFEVSFSGAPPDVSPSFVVSTTSVVGVLLGVGILLAPSFSFTTTTGTLLPVVFSFLLPKKSISTGSFRVHGLEVL